MQTFANYSDAKTAAERIVRELAEGSQVPRSTPANRVTRSPPCNGSNPFGKPPERLSLLAVVSEHVGLLEKLNGRSPGEAIDGFLQTVVRVAKTFRRRWSNFLRRTRAQGQAKDGNGAQLSANYETHVAG